MRLIAAVSLLLGLAQGSPSKSKELSLCKEHLLNEPEIDLYSLEISPDITRTGDEVNIRFVGKTNTDIVSLSTKLSLSILGIEVHSDTFDVCEGNAMKCPIYKGQTFEGGFRYKLPEDHPEGVDTNVRVEFITKVRVDATTSISKDLACVETDFTVKDSASASSGRFYFDDSEMKFLFNKWFKQHEDDIHIPREEMKFNKEGKHFLFTSPNRQKIFEDNLMKIAIHNAQQDKGIHTYKMGMNQFGHLTSKEFKRIFASGLRPELKASFNPSEELNSPKKYGGVFHNKPLVTPQLGIDQTNPVFSWFKTERRLRTAVKQQLSLPKEVNWVKEGAVTDVKNQGACGSCWSFATTGALEGAYFVKHRKLVSFSEQELVSCDQTDLGCDGGAMENAYLFIEQNNGLCSEVDYPYTAAMGERGLCRFNETKIDAFGRTTVSDVCKPVKGSRVQRFVDVDHTDMSLEEAVAKQPVAVGVEADETGFQFYSSGVLTSKCSQKLDHGVLVVGYGVEQDETTGEEVKYWLVKNSWGEMWGLHGYIKILRDTDEEIGGECGILLMPSYPEV